ncbi:DegT/DnrJ/EryC1/StrS family aminotransferase [Synechocystis sp. LKSZ1]|uniref:DegT/DnrJ/EryC1/StrS family aminotransferase n=1 Tax=Synechocystis sp. LKSZ1 TaxID=3144951 RepID=UPI00336BC230
MNKLPPVDLARQYQQIDAEASAAALAVLRSGYYIGGTVVSEFEQAFAQSVGMPHCVSCNSGTDALYLALRALGIGPGDEVITSAFTFFATAEMISAAGAKPVFIDIDPATFNLNPSLIEAAITPRTKAIMPVHLFGQAVDMTQVMALANQYQLKVIEDCAQATGAQWQGKTVGSWGDVGAFSFFPTKNLGGCGDGGAMTVQSERLAAELRMLKEHGSRQRYYHEAIGVNSRLDALQAAVLQVKLRYLEQWNQARQILAQNYDRLLAPLPGIILPTALAGGIHVWNQYTIRVLSDTSSPSHRRDRVREQLLAQGIISMIYYPIPLHQQHVYGELGYGAGTLPHTEQVATEVLSLPLFPEMTVAEQERVVYALKEIL